MLDIIIFYLKNYRLRALEVSESKPCDLLVSIIEALAIYFCVHLARVSTIFVDYNVSLCIQSCFPLPAVFCFVCDCIVCIQNFLFYFISCRNFKNTVLLVLSWFWLVIKLIYMKVEVYLLRYYFTLYREVGI